MKVRASQTAGFLAVVLGLGALAAPAAAAPKPGSGTPITVMTRNIYLGGDITRPLDATEGLSGLAALLAFGNANDELRRIVDRTDFPARSAALAREIATTGPDVVGLQEVALWRHGPLELADVGTADAVTVDYDFLQILLDELAALGAAYRVVTVQEESDVEGPAFDGNPFAGTSTRAADVRLTMRDVLLVREGAVTVEASGSAQYTTRIAFEIAGKAFSFIRGYNWADIRVGAKRLRVVNTHLESQSSLVALLQAQELLGGPASTPRPVVLLCDCNSDPLDHSTKPTDPVPVPHSAAYGLLTGAGGLVDEWLQFAPASEGWTSGFSELVNDPDTSAIDHRIDLVLARGFGGAPTPADKGQIVGVDPDERVGTLWPSDHAGVVLRLRL